MRVWKCAHYYPMPPDVWVIEPKTGRKVGKLEMPRTRGFFSGVLPRRKNPFRYQLAVTGTVSKPD